MAVSRLVNQRRDRSVRQPIWIEHQVNESWAAHYAGEELCSLKRHSCVVFVQLCAPVQIMYITLYGRTLELGLCCVCVLQDKTFSSVCVRVVHKSGRVREERARLRSLRLLRHFLQLCSECWCVTLQHCSTSPPLLLPPSPFLALVTSLIRRLFVPPPRAHLLFFYPSSILHLIDVLLLLN